MTPTFPQPTAIRVYTAILTQSGTGAPVATVLHNTLGRTSAGVQNTFTWTRSGVGSYRGSLTEDLDPANTAVFIQNPAILSHVGAGITGGNVYLENNNIAAPNANVDNLAELVVEVRIYNI